MRLVLELLGFAPAGAKEANACASPTYLAAHECAVRGRELLELGSLAVDGPALDRHEPCDGVVESPEGLPACGVLSSLASRRA